MVKPTNLRSSFFSGALPEPKIESEEAPVDADVLEAQLEQYHNGIQLRRLRLDPGWEILWNAITSYRDKAAKQLIGLDPGSPNVMTAHAAASALDDFCSKFQQDIDAAIEMAVNPPEELKSYMMRAREVSDPMRVMQK